MGERVPETQALRTKSVAVFGLGCLGAPSALELARSGVGELRLVDADFVDPGTISRWPYGLEVAGLPKAAVIARAIEANYPYTRVKAIGHRVGGVRNDADMASDTSILKTVTEGVCAIYDATAEVGVQHLLSDWAREQGVVYVAVEGTHGGWGGKVVRIQPGKTPGCWLCQRHAFADGSFAEPPSDPSGEIQPAGCGDPTFTGSGFDMAQIALTGVRMVVSSLCAGEEGGYPAAEWDVTVAAFRSREGKLIPPKFTGHVLNRHPDCAGCGIK